MKIVRFEDILSWQKSKELAVERYAVFKDEKDFSFRNQMQRASVSVMNNISEGLERQPIRSLNNFCISPKTLVASFVQTLYLRKN
jgi:four helix bundle protein